MEKLENVELWDENYEEPKQVIINTEWGAFGDGALDFICTKYDYDIDANSLNPGKQIYEKMISGMYMGEIVRLALVDLCEQGLLFNGAGSEELFTRGQFFTKYVSEIESDGSDDFTNTRQVLDEIGIEFVSQEDCAIVQYTCALISARAAYLASAGVAAILNKMNRPKVTVAVDGSLYRYHPKFHNLMMDKIGKLTKDIEYKLILSEDGSGKGAALVAAVACRLAREKTQSNPNLLSTASDDNSHLSLSNQSKNIHHTLSTSNSNIINSDDSKSSNMSEINAQNISHITMYNSTHDKSAKDLQDNFSKLNLQSNSQPSTPNNTNSVNSNSARNNDLGDDHL